MADEYCEICYNSQNKSSSVYITCSHNSPHKHLIICAECINDSAKYDWPTCVCSRKLSYKLLSNLLIPIRFQAFTERINNIAIRELPNITHCPLCSNGFTYKCRKKWKLKCPWPECARKSCIKCHKKWKKGHKQKCSGISNVQKMVNKTDTKLNKKKDRKKKYKSKKCPKCSTLITRDGGCDHIICTGCSYEFCWKCLQKYGDYDCDCYY